MSGTTRNPHPSEWGGSQEDNTLLQQYLFVPVQQTALQLARQLLAHPRRVLDVGCGTGRLLRQARPCYPTAELVGVDLALRHWTDLPAELATALTGHRMAVIGRDHTPWFGLPDVQVIAARQQRQPSANLPLASP
jgi:hypothetical protein